MNYKSASSQKNKLATAELENGKQAIAISLQQWIETQIDNKIRNIQPRNTTLPITTQWDSTWITATQNTTDYLWIDWNLAIGKFNYNWLSRFSIAIVVKNIGEDYQISKGANFGKFIGWDIKDIVGNEGSQIKDIKLNASIFIHKIGTPVFQAKLLVKYIAQACHD